MLFILEAEAVRKFVYHDLCLLAFSVFFFFYDYVLCIIIEVQVDARLLQVTTYQIMDQPGYSLVIWGAVVLRSR